MNTHWASCNVATEGNGENLNKGEEASSEDHMHTEHRRQESVGDTLVGALSNRRSH